MRKNARRKGFTLTELLIVIGIIGFLAAAIFVAVDPVKRIQNARDTRRSSEARAILSALLKKQVDDRASYDGETSAPIITDDNKSQVIVEDDTGIVCNAEATRPGCDQALDTAAADKDCVANLSGLVPIYLAVIPQDPGGGTLCTSSSSGGCTTEGDLAIGATNSGYYIHRTIGNRIEIGACAPERATTIYTKR